MLRWAVIVALGVGCQGEPTAPRRPLVLPAGGASEPAAEHPAAASQPAASQPAASQPAAPATTPGHDRMVRALAAIRDDTAAHNRYLGDAALRALDAAGPPADPAGRTRWAFERGRELLRLGRTTEAVAAAEEAVALAAKLPAALRGAVEVQALLQRGVAGLRQGEDENCAGAHGPEACIAPIQGSGVHRRPAGAEAAIEAFARVLSHPAAWREARITALWLLNLAHQTLGTWPDALPAAWRVRPAVFASPPFRVFTDVAPAVGLDLFDLSGGVVVDDFDGDGVLDVITSSWDPAARLHCFRRGPDGRYVERGVEAGFSGILGGLHLIHGDVDNDGDLDLFVPRGAWLLEDGAHPNSLLLNDGHGHFEDATFAAGLALPARPTQTAAFLDYDLDGDLDLYVGNESRGGRENPSQLFRNEGDGTFTDVAQAAGVESFRFAKGVTVGDYDGDRWPDLYVSNLGMENRLYRNRGDGTFEDVAPRLGVTRPINGFPTWFWDFDNDGVLDLFAANGYAVHPIDTPIWKVAADYLGEAHDGERLHLYRGNGRGGFTDVAAEVGLTRHTLPMGAGFGDLDDDGDLEIYLGTGYPDYEGLVPNVLFLNENGRFVDVTFSARVGHLQKGHGVAFADLDGDGDQDLFEQLGGAYPGDRFHNVLFANPGPAGEAIEVRLVGTRSNRSGFGARVRVDAGGRAVYRHVGSLSSFGGNPLAVQVGLGTAEKARLEVYWPASDTRQVFEVRAGQRVVVTEGGGLTAR
ncbi:MAG: CRTAC1 family protein [Myxococcales bacterium]|nr:CRTAC1 family protein [Myxococcales bacterium]